ncbi:hypothetical protein QBC44DRAFT_247268 [Cladorrhinum sp. PSN332]|nr:hypothetical protein QBC44DRAFT_247268 [Cladorrhinum sp. PSN332]
MEHLRKSYWNIGTEDVNYFHSLDACLARRWDHHAPEYCDPSSRCHGAEYRDFIGFPKAHGILVNNQYRMNNSMPAQSSERSMTVDEFLQAWLFFGLLRCVVQGKNGAPVLDHDKLWKGKGEHRLLTTADLPEALKQWQDGLAMLHAKQPEVAELRCIHAIQMLSLAKRVVTTNLSEDSVPLDLSGSTPDLYFDKRSLCLMILGETLCAALAQIMNRCNIKIAGWEMDQEGWGRPVLVRERMEKHGWCPRYQTVLKGQLGQNATLLYAAVAETLKHGVDHGPENMWMIHEKRVKKKCSPTRCYYVEAKNEKGQYEPQHALGCKGKSCRSVGPDEKELLNSLRLLKKSIDRNGSKVTSFPLLRISGESNDELTFHVEQWKHGVQFATISHVWSQGLGNHSSPKILSCQAHYIRSLLNRLEWDGQGVAHDQSHLFWLDTLLIPPSFDHTNLVDKDELAALRRASVKSIFDFFDRATHGIIIDRHVMRGNTANARTIGINLLSSGWMKRLWTLQEAFVTKRLSIAFQGGEIRELDTLWSVDENEESDFNGLDAGTRLEISMTDMVRKKVFQNLMGDTRKARNQRDGENTTPWPLLIASAWNSARYRDVGEMEKETFALASLFNISPDQQTYEKGQEWRQCKLEENNPVRKQARLELMRAFWMKIEEKGGIHPGMIFLPGERLLLPGFAWAPMTWMSSNDESYPYPLTTLPIHPATLNSNSKGLVVQYPGYVLRVTREKCREIISQPRPPRAKEDATLGEDSGFEFSVSLGLYDLYQARNFPHEQAEQSVISKLLHQLEPENAKGLKLGIILSRCRPADFPCEIALLVEIYDNTDGIIYCRTIRRLKLSRLTVYPSSLVRAPDSNNASILDVYHAFDGRIIAEAVNEHQKWCVDGYIISNEEGASSGGEAQPQVSQREPLGNEGGQEPPQNNPPLNRSGGEALPQVSQREPLGNEGGQEPPQTNPPLNRSETGLSLTRRLGEFNLKRMRDRIVRQVRRSNTVEMARE